LAVRGVTRFLLTRGHHEPTEADAHQRNRERVVAYIATQVAAEIGRRTPPPIVDRLVHQLTGGQLLLDRVERRTDFSARLFEIAFDLLGALVFLVAIHRIFS